MTRRKTSRNPKLVGNRRRRTSRNGRRRKTSRNVQGRAKNRFARWSPAGSGLGTPDIITGMSYGGTRYKFNYGISIDHLEKDNEYVVWQAGDSKILGKARTLDAAKKIAIEKGDLR